MLEGRKLPSRARSSGLEPTCLLADARSLDIRPRGMPAAPHERSARVRVMRAPALRRQLSFVSRVLPAAASCCTHALGHLDLAMTSPRLCLWSTQTAKKSRDSESLSGHSSDAPDENADGEEPVDAATLEAQVARLRQLVVKARPACSLLARLPPSL